MTYSGLRLSEAGRTMQTCGWAALSAQMLGVVLRHLRRPPVCSYLEGPVRRLAFGLYVAVATVACPAAALAQGPRNVTRSPASENAVAWSPDSRQILVSSNRSGVYDIYLLSLDGPRFEQPVFHSLADDFVGAWSSQRGIAFVSLRDGNPEIYVAAGVGAPARNVSMHPGADWLPSWGVDGTLVYNTSRFGGLPEIVIGAEASSLVRITEDEFYDAGAELSPDGRQVLYHSRRDGNYDLYLKNLADGTVDRLTSHPADDSYGSWSPDGRRIAFRSARDGNSEIYTIEIATREVARFLHWPASSENHPAWSPDGACIAFISDRDGNDEVYVAAAPGRLDCAAAAVNHLNVSINEIRERIVLEVR